LPGYVVLTRLSDEPPGGHRNWGTGFMPSVYQGTKFRDGATPILHLAPPAGIFAGPPTAQARFRPRAQRASRRTRMEDDQLEARIASYELATACVGRTEGGRPVGRNGKHTPPLRTRPKETAHTAATACSPADWSSAASASCNSTSARAANGTPMRPAGQPFALTAANRIAQCRPAQDLKQRGILDSTLVIWAANSAATPMSESGTGRDHNPYGFTMWLAGGGIRAASRTARPTRSASGAVENKVHVHDIHATILHCCGLADEKLTYPHNGRDERPTVNGGRVIQAVLAELSATSGATAGVPHPVRHAAYC